MKIGIIGTGDVGKSLGKGFLATGNETMMGSRERLNQKSQKWAEEMGPKASTGTFSDAAQFGEIVVLAALGLATPDAIKMAGVENFKNKIVLDATNPLDFSEGPPPTLIGGIGTSGGEKHQAMLPDAFVVKVFNTVGNALFYKPQLQGGPPDMFICGDNQSAKKQVRHICEQFGWNTIDIGAISASHYLEAMCAVWVISALESNNWMQAYKMLKKA